MADAERKIVIGPQPGAQTMMVACPANEILAGGARGGSKSYGMLLDWAAHARRWGKFARGLISRPTYPELEEFISKSAEVYPLLGAQWRASPRMWIFPDGGTVKMRHMKTARDADLYQGHSYTYIGVEEVGNHPNPDAVNKLRATMRSPDGVKVRMMLNCNPGGSGHNWLKARFIDPAPPLTIITEMIDGIPWTRCFVPATLDDNLILMRQDPGYRANIIQACEGKPWLLEAWLHGSWDIVAGGMFDATWNPRVHVVRPFAIPRSWYMDRSYDHGSSAPFSVGWWAESDGTEVRLHDGTTRHFARGTLFRVAEWYGWNGKPNKGNTMLVSDIAKGVIEREKAMGIHHRVQPGPADTSIWDVMNGTCIATDFSTAGVEWTRADKGPGSRKAGWEKIRDMLNNSMSHQDKPGIYVFQTCRHFIRTVPVLPRDEKDPDDVSTESEDHCFGGDTLVLTPDGPQRIAAMPEEGVVMTPEGWRGYDRCGLKIKNAECVSVRVNSTDVIATPDHKAHVAGQWYEISEIPHAEEVTVAGKHDVYCLRVPSVGAFVLANGLVVANCGDETRYRLRANRHIGSSGPVFGS